MGSVFRNDADVRRYDVTVQRIGQFKDSLEVIDLFRVVRRLFKTETAQLAAKGDDRLMAVAGGPANVFDRFFGDGSRIQLVCGVNLDAACAAAFRFADALDQADAKPVGHGTNLEHSLVPHSPTLIQRPSRALRTTASQSVISRRPSSKFANSPFEVSPFSIAE